MTINAYIQRVETQGWESFPGRLWQRSFHDRIIRTEAEWNVLRQHILSNPARWEDDAFYSCHQPIA